MSKIAFIVFIMAAPTLAGIAVVAVLTLGWFDYKSVIISAAVGALAAIPLSYFVGGRISKLGI